MKGIFVFLDNNKSEIKRLSVNKLPFKKETIIQKSMEIFNDDDPCIIHSTYSANYLGIDLLDYLNKTYPKDTELTFDIHNCPNCITDIVELSQDVAYINII